MPLPVPVAPLPGPTPLAADIDDEEDDDDRKLSLALALDGARDLEQDSHPCLRLSSLLLEEALALAESDGGIVIPGDASANTPLLAEQPEEGVKEDGSPPADDDAEEDTSSKTMPPLLLGA